MNRTRFLSLGAVVVAGMCAAATAVPAHGADATELDGPGRYFLVRTFPQTAGPTPEQNAACDAYFGPVRAQTAGLRQAAVQFAPEVDGTGLAVEEAASYVGPGYICGAPGANPDFTEVFAIADVPAGRATLHGSCKASLLEIVRAAAFLGCRVAIDPIAGVSTGGYAVSNTVAGSLFVGYLSTAGTELPANDVGLEPGWQTLPNDPDFYLWRSFDHTAPDTSTGGGCAQDLPVDLAGGAVAVRSAALSATQPDPVSGFLPSDEPTVRAGAVTLCVSDDGSALAQAEFDRAGTAAHLSAEGDCRTAPSEAGPDLLVQTCVLGVVYADTPLFRAGQLTSIGLVHAETGVPANSHIWTLGILDEETGVTP